MDITPRQAVEFIRRIFPIESDHKVAIGIIATRLEEGDTLTDAIRLGHQAVIAPGRKPDETRIFKELRRRTGL